MLQKLLAVLISHFNFWSACIFQNSFILELERIQQRKALECFSLLFLFQKNYFHYR